LLSQASWHPRSTSPSFGPVAEPLTRSTRQQSRAGAEHGGHVGPGRAGGAPARQDVVFHIKGVGALGRAIRGSTSTQQVFLKRKNRRNTAGSTEYKARQDLDEGDADGTKLYSEYKRGELLIHGEETYKKIKLDLKAMNEFLNNTKESEHAAPRSNSSVESPMEQYLTPLSDEETQASYQSWINQLKAQKKQRQLKMLHGK